MGLDEFSLRKDRVYDTAVMDLERKWVLGVVMRLRRRGGGGLLHPPRRAPEEGQVVVMDMHEPFRQVVELCLPKAKVVADKFHVVLHVHRALDQSLP